MRNIRKYIRNRKGQALVEFALILPLFLFLILGMTAFGLVLHDYIVVAEAARVGARVAAVGGSDTAVTNAIKLAAPGIADELIIPSPTGSAAGTPVTVTVTHPRTLSIIKVANPQEGNGAFFDILPSATINVTGSAVMRIEVAR